MIRKNLGKGKGKGYKNILGNDKTVHSQSAKGIKQSSKINESRLNSIDKLKNKSYKQLQKEGIKLSKTGDIDKDGVMNSKDCQPLNPNKQGFWHDALEKIKRGEEIVIDTSKESLQKMKEQIPLLASNLKEDAKQLYAVAKEKYDDSNIKENVKMKASDLWEKGKEFTKEKVVQFKESQALNKAKDLSTIDHPLSKKIINQKNRVQTLEKHYDETEDEKEKEELGLELKEEREQYREIQEEISNINIQNLSNADLEKLAVNYVDDSFFGFGDGNKYKKELLRRVKAKKEIDFEVNEIKKKPFKKEEGIFDDLF